MFTRIGVITRAEMLKICQFSEHQRPQHPVRTKFTGIIERTHDDSRVLMKPHEVSSSRVEESRVVNIPFNQVEQETTTKKQYSEDFESWWLSYPRKVAKGDAWKAWQKLNKNNELPDVDVLIAKSEAYGRFQTDIKFVKHPATWLNSLGWLDELAVPKPAIDPDWWMYQQTLEQA